jgi:hypothetical protein
MWEYNTEMNGKVIGWECVYWIHLAEDRDCWRDLVNTVMNLLIP